MKSSTAILDPTMKVYPSTVSERSSFSRLSGRSSALVDIFSDSTKSLTLPVYLLISGVACGMSLSTNALFCCMKKLTAKVRLPSRARETSFKLGHNYLAFIADLFYFPICIFEPFFSVPLLSLVISAAAFLGDDTKTLVLFVRMCYARRAVRTLHPQTDYHLCPQFTTSTIFVLELFTRIFVLVEHALYICRKFLCLDSYIYAQSASSTIFVLCT